MDAEKTAAAETAAAETTAAETTAAETTAAVVVAQQVVRRASTRCYEQHFLRGLGQMLAQPIAEDRQPAGGIVTDQQSMGR